MDPFIFIILLFSTVLIVLILLLPNLKGKMGCISACRCRDTVIMVYWIAPGRKYRFWNGSGISDPVPCIGHGALYSEGHHKTKMTRLSQALSSPRLLFCTLFREKSLKSDKIRKNLT